MAYVNGITSTCRRFDPDFGIRHETVFLLYANNELKGGMYSAARFEHTSEVVSELDDLFKPLVAA